jgi:hypothetical protein
VSIVFSRDFLGDDLTAPETSLLLFVLVRGGASVDPMMWIWCDLAWLWLPDRACLGEGGAALVRLPATMSLDAKVAVGKHFAVGVLSEDVLGVSEDLYNLHLFWKGNL